jgi:D-amino peptidase
MRIVKLYVSSDMEGTAGVVDWSQCRGPGPGYDAACALLLDEVNAAIDGAVQSGVTEVLVNDSHGAMANLPPDGLHHGASYVSGRHKPLYMMERLAPGFDAVFFVSYHGSMGSNGVLSHTYNPRAVGEVHLNGTLAGESAINGLAALGHGVPVALVTGDQVTIEEAAPFFPEAVGVVVKQAITRASAESLHPSRACELIRAGASEAMGKVAGGSVGLPRIELPATVEITWLTADMAELVEPLRGARRTSPRTVEITDDDPLRLYRTFTTAVALTRAIVDL